jgi:hypothetical protein
MARAARFVVGTSGSGHHTEVQGDGKSLGGAGRQGARGPNAGAGAEAQRVTATWSNGMKNNSGKGVSPGRRYSEG